MKHLKEYNQNLRKGLKSIGFEDPLPDFIEPSDFFDATMDHDDYVDVSGPAAEMSINDLIYEFNERVNGIPSKHRASALQAIKNLWIEKIESDLK